MFRNYDTAFMNLFQPAVLKLVEDNSQQQEHSNRLAAEIITGMVQGSKHWDFDRVSSCSTASIDEDCINKTLDGSGPNYC